MDLRHTIRRKDGKVHRYWTLVRSVRVGRRVFQQTVAQLGELDEQGQIEARVLARRLIGAPEESPLFDDGSEHLTAPVRLKGVRIERSHQFGEVYLALALWRGLGLEEVCRRLLPDRPGTGRLGEDGGGAGDGSAVRAVERAAHCRGLVSCALRLSRPSTASLSTMRCSPATPTTQKTLQMIVAAMEARHGALGRVWIADRGMASAENLAWLRETGKRAIVGTPKSELKKFGSELARSDGWRMVQEGVEVKLARHPETDETVILCRSDDRRSKEQAMHDEFSRRIEQAVSSSARCGRTGVRARLIRRR